MQYFNTMVFVTSGGIGADFYFKSVRKTSDFALSVYVGVPSVGVVSAKYNSYSIRYPSVANNNGSQHVLGMLSLTTKCHGNSRVLTASVLAYWHKSRVVMRQSSLRPL